jgi:putative FmdB family regulatory protein
VPTYEYECDRCGPFEVEQKISDPPLTQCPRIETTIRRDGRVEEICCAPVKRLIPGSTSFVLKGPGWFKDGY